MHKYQEKSVPGLNEIENLLLRKILVFCLKVP